MCETLQLNWKLPSSNNNILKKSSDQQKKRKKSYTLRACSVKKRQETEIRKTQPRKRGPKPRPRPLPMSKYRRKTANLRERQRMGEINVAFENLREKIPSLAVAGKGRCEKMTKINVLHVAITYIRALENILETGDAGIQEYGTAIVQSPFIPLIPDPASPEEQKPSTPRRVERKLRDYSVCSNSNNSGSEDSGIMDEDDEAMDDADEEEEEDDDENDGKACLDWTELTSTLDFPPAVVCAANDPSNDKLLPPPPTLTRGNLDTLLALSSVVSPPPGFLLTKEDLSPGFLLNKEERKVLQPKMMLNRQTSFPDLGEGDLFSDLNSSFDSLEGCFTTEIIGFANEDPFQLIF